MNQAGRASKKLESLRYEKPRASANSCADKPEASSSLGGAPILH